MSMHESRLNTVIRILEHFWPDYLVLKLNRMADWPNHVGFNS